MIATAGAAMSGRILGSEILTDQLGQDLCCARSQEDVRTHLEFKPDTVSAARMGSA
jgi:hypothetical protein